jgi:hypothetical protein
MQMANAFPGLGGEDYSSMGRFHATSFKSHFSFMKTSRFTITLPVFILAATISTNFSHAQTTGSSVPVSNAGQPTLQMGTYQVTERDASGYCGAQLTVTNSGVHTVTSSQPIEVQVYGWGQADAYGYFGGVVK